MKIAHMSQQTYHHLSESLPPKLGSLLHFAFWRGCSGKASLSLQAEGWLPSCRSPKNCPQLGKAPCPKSHLPTQGQPASSGYSMHPYEGLLLSFQFGTTLKDSSSFRALHGVIGLLLILVQPNSPSAQSYFLSISHRGCPWEHFHEANLPALLSPAQTLLPGNLTCHTSLQLFSTQ